MRVCVDLAGNLIEAQSGDDVAYGTLIDNALNAGYSKDSVQEKVVPYSEYLSLLAKAIQPAVKEISANDLFTALKAKTLLTDADLQSVIDASPQRAINV